MSHSQRVLRRLTPLILICVLGALVGVQAQPLLPPNPEAATLLAALNRASDLLAASASLEDAMVIRNVTLHVSADLLRDHGAVSAITSNGRDVYVALSFAYDLSLAAEVQYVERAFGAPDLMRRYFRHFQESWQFDGRKLLPIDEFAFLDETSRVRLKSPEVQRQIAGWVDYALVFTLAHELGHQTRNAVYLPNAPDAVKQQQEQIADEWATEAMLAAGYSPLHAMILLTELMEFQERFLPAGYEGSHPPTPNRALHLLQKYRSQQRALYQTPRYSMVPLQVYLRMEEQWAKDIEAMRQRRAERTLASLEQKSADGDTDASETLAYDYMNGIGVPVDSAKSRLYLERAAAGGNFWAQSTLGVRYANGTLGQPDFARSRLWLGLAASVGDKAAKWSLDIVAKTAPAAAWCQGRCVLDAVAADLKLCEDRTRTRCVNSCEHRYGHSRADCESRYCNNMSDEQRYFAGCFEEPSAERWQSCALSCDPKSVPAVTGANASTGQPPTESGKALPLDSFSRALAQVAASARQGLTSVRGTATHREPDDSFTIYRASQSLPGMTDCQVMVNDDTSDSPSYYCDQYRGQSIDQAARDYKALVSRFNSALSALGAAPCTESTRRSGSRVPREVTSCRSDLPGRVGVRVQKASSTYVSTGTTSFTVDLWVDAPSQ